ncbi:uncharacterized protein LOC133732332 [Rosa rugosa]|uniref:uncharacterized protein LOC133732332 n=1 Tax=Rosa rugosa TaxID=74645 RepID=UPI002B413826|nr:uncharacterized protein LOC133732332 [Rosa rugosa]XP_062015846.1 uncharacterized protein LOC133732332 [Rosa rugosa]
MENGGNHGGESSYPNADQTETEIQKKTTLESESLAKGLSSTLATIIKDFDSKAQQTFTSQDQLSQALDRLTRELDKLLEDAPLPFIMQHAAKITAVRKRVLSLNSVLKNVQRRLDNIDRILTLGAPHQNQHDKTSTEHSGLQ